MIKRLFKLLYVIALIVIVLSLPIYLLSEISFDQIVVSTYKAKCLQNGKYVVLQGGSEPYTFDEIGLEDQIFQNVRQDLNFYCRYYDQIQPHITSYLNSNTLEETRNANINFSNFKSPVISSVYSYPELFNLEEVSSETRYYEVYGPVIAWLIYAIFAFITIQILKICYIYIVFGKVIWHPFKYPTE